MKSVVILLGLGIAAVAALPTDHEEVIIKMDDGGPRYQYMASPDGPKLVDLWLKKSDIEAMSRYNPDVNNNYHLFTRSNRGTSQPIPLGANGVLQNSHFNANRKTCILMHGWQNVPTSDFNVHLVAAYLDAEDVNVIMVDWSIGAAADYLTAVNNVIRSADHVARYINWLIGASGGNIARYHLIGHSLGAHQSGIVGRHLGGRVPYLTGLDPAMPGWLTHSQALSSNAAIYTEVMHTDAGFYGITNPAGHVDFYPNGGRGMPGCGDRNCDHHQCIFYMAESLRRGGFTGRRCGNVNEALNGNCNQAGNLHMGGTNAKTGNSGLFHLRTNDRSPFSQG